MPTQALLNSRLRVQQFGRDWLLPLWQWLASVRAERWRRAVLILCAIWVVANLARLVWLLLPLHDAKAAAAPAPVNAAAGQSRRATRSTVDIDTLAGWHLFGEVGAEPNRGAGKIEEQAENTSLNLQLLGAINASDPKLARAIIQADGRQQQFAIGEQLPGSGKVVLSKVLDDRVILDNNGRYETLWLYDPNASPRVAAAVSTPTESPYSHLPFRPKSGLSPDQMRQQFLERSANRPKNPSLSDVIQVSPVNEGGKLVGYRVRPGRDQKRFEQFGFQPDDVVTGINGVTLDDPQRALDLYNTMRTAKQATFAVRRAGGDVSLSVSMENNNGGSE